MKTNKKEIHIEDILYYCQEYTLEAQQDIYDTVDLNINDDLHMILSDYVFWHFVDDDSYEEPDVDDIYNSVAIYYLKRPDLVDD